MPLARITPLHGEQRKVTGQVEGGHGLSMGGVTQPVTLGRRRCDRQVFQLRCETPAEAIGQALGQLSTGELRAPSRHLAARTEYCGPDARA
jgi:hypothetical protein